MQAQNRPVRFNGTVSSKRHVLGNRAGHAPPAWRNHGVVVPSQAGANGTMNGKGKETGSKILLSRLPTDVGDKEVEELFQKTVGPLRDAFLIYNSQGNSKGMAVVTFQRPGDAAVARAKYDGKIVDGRKPLKIEIVYDGEPSVTVAAVPGQPSLLHRIGQVAGMPTPKVQGVKTGPASTRPLVVAPVTSAQVPPRRMRQKKGPKRLKKVVTGYTQSHRPHRPASKDDLDKEMDAYRAEAEAILS